MLQIPYDQANLDEGLRTNGRPMTRGPHISGAIGFYALTVHYGRYLHRKSNRETPEEARILLFAINGSAEGSDTIPCATLGTLRRTVSEDLIVVISEMHKSPEMIMRT